MAAPTFVNAGARQSTGFGESITPALPASLVNGNVLIAMVGNGATQGKTFTFPAGWTSLHEFANVNIGVAVYYHVVVGGESAPAITWSGNTSAQAKIWQFSGTVSPHVGDGSAVEDPGNNADWDHPALTTTADNSLVAAFLYNNVGRTVDGVPSGWSELSDEANIAAFGDEVAVAGQTSTAIVDQPFTVGATRYLSLEVELLSESPVATLDLQASFDDAGSDFVAGVTLTPVLSIAAAFDDASDFVAVVTLDGEQQIPVQPLPPPLPPVVVVVINR
jgi:hypothetical protein